jgi:hypothetical protein
MGDETAQAGVSGEVSRQDSAVPTVSTPVPHSPSHIATEYPSDLSAPRRQQHEQPANPQHAFMPQLMMAHQQRTATFDMSAMANSLPPGPYRAPSYGHGSQRYNTAMAHMPPPHFGLPSTVGDMPAQGYYLPQHAHMAQLYQAPLPPQPPHAMTSRPDLGYYASPVVMNQAPHGGAHFYYTPTAAFQGHVPHAHGHAALGHYGLLPNLHQHPESGPQQSLSGVQEPLRDPASPGPQVNGRLQGLEGHIPVQGQNHNIAYAAGAAAGRQNIVRGPPRKPRQSGESEAGSRR